jgi:hypothetical protein
MQALFDRLDAELEFETLVSRSKPGADTSTYVDDGQSLRRRIIESVSLAVLLSMFVFVLTQQVVSADWVTSPEEIDPEPINPNFVIEIPPKVKIQPEIKPKPLEKVPEPRPVERLRSVPDRQLEYKRTLAETKTRETKIQQSDRQVSDKASQRALPAVTTPVIDDNVETIHRSVGSEVLAHSILDADSDTMRVYASTEGSENSHRSSFDDGPSRIELDDYHYQMVNVCLRLCMKSMFTRDGLTRSQLENSSGWLRVENGRTAMFEYLSGGKWLQFRVFVEEIADISHIDFVELPLRGNSSHDINELLEKITADLCSLLGYSDCLDQLTH